MASRDRAPLARRRATAGLAAAGTTAALLLAVPFDRAVATYAGGDGLIAFVGSEGNDYDIYVADPEDGTPINLTDTPGSTEHDPAWSPAGDRLAFSRSQQHYDIWVMNADGSEPLNLTPGANDGQGNSGRRPTWSPDGTRIVYEDAGELWSMAADGTDKLNLTQTGAAEGLEGDPVYSPDGERIAFMRDLDLWVMDADGTDPVPLAEASAAERSPDWSPDGEMIVYERGGEIWQVRPDGSDAAALFTSVQGGGTAPAYSPAGGHVAFSSSALGATGGPDIAVVGVDGSDPRRVTGVALSDLEPAWQPVVDSVNMAVSVTDQPDPVRVDEPVTYTMTVDNLSHGRDARFVSLALLLPSRARFESVTADQGSCSRRRSTITCALGTIAGRSSAEVTLVVTPTSTFDLTLAGTVMAGHPDPSPADNSFRTGTEVLPPASETPRALLTWSVPDRFADHDHDGMLDENRFNNPKAARLPFRMVLHGCDSAPFGSITRYRFAVTLPGGTVLKQDSASCDFEFEPPVEGTYPVDLRITTASGENARITKDVPYRDYFIVSLGDSIASGEGNPDRICDQGCHAWDPPETWQNRPCHRSALSGPSQAAWMIEANDPTTSVTFTHLACSGAQVTLGILQAWPGIEPNGDQMVKPQADIMAALMKQWGRKPDAVLISIGANDAQFADAVLECLNVGRCQNNETFVGSVKQRLDRLPSRYTKLDRKLDELRIPGRRVFITEYPDVTRNEEGEFTQCLPTLYPSEWEWADAHVVDPLNAHVRQAANRDKLGWNFVTGIHSRFRDHGYCSVANWIVRLEESIDWQGDEKGAFHPNNAGHQVYAQQIAAAVRPKLE